MLLMLDRYVFPIVTWNPPVQKVFGSWEYLFNIWHTMVPNSNIFQSNLSLLFFLLCFIKPKSTLFLEKATEVNK